MASLRALAESLGSGLLEVVAAPRGLDVEATELVIHDPSQWIEAKAGDVVVGVGVTSDLEGCRLVARLGLAGATALVVRERVARGLRVEAEHAGVALLAVHPGAPWGHVILLLSSVISRDSLASGEALAGADPGDLFSVANVVADLVDAPVTIEDPSSRVLAFSTRQDEADESRIATILGRQVPSVWRRKLMERSVFRRLSVERGPIYIEELAPGVLPRVAIAVRAGDEVLGSIWAAVKGPLSPERERALGEAAPFVALHLIRHRLTADIGSAFESQLLGAVLQGGPLAVDAARRLGLEGATYWVVAAGAEGEAQGALHLARMRDLLTLHLSSSSGRRVVVGEVAQVLYAVVPVATRSRRLPPAIRQGLERFVVRGTDTLGVRILAAVGASADSIAALPEARESADRTLRVLRTMDGHGQVTEFAEVQAAALLLKFADSCGGDVSLRDGPLALLRDHDRQSGTALVATLRTYFDEFGDVTAVARRLGVHPNTIRYRLRQLQSIAEVDLKDPRQRLALILQVHLPPPSASVV